MFVPSLSWQNDPFFKYNIWHLKQKEAFFGTQVGGEGHLRHHGRCGTRPFLSDFYIKTTSFCQDKLGTDTGKR